MKTALAGLAARFPQEVEKVYSTPQGDDYVVVRPAGLRAVAQACKADGFTLFVSMCAVDRLLLPEPTPRFEVVYQVRQGQEPFKKLHLKTFVPEEKPELDSLQPVWKGADWFERYAWDFYGLRFLGHPDLRRVLLYEEFQGHPLRKDYPMRKRQPLVAERTFPDLIRGPGAATPAK